MSKLYNIIIIGSGPAAYTACLYTKHKNPLLLRGSSSIGGQLTTTTTVDNYPGFPEGVDGPELMDLMYERLIKENGKSGDEFLNGGENSDCNVDNNNSTVNNGDCNVDNNNINNINNNNKIQIKDETVTLLEKQDTIFTIKTTKSTYKTKSVIIATGATARKLQVPGSDTYWTKGISACAVCDGYFYMQKTCAVIGGGDAAMEEVLFLSKICKKVYLIHRRHEFRSRQDKLNEVRNTNNIEIIVPYNLIECKGNKLLNSIKIINTENNEIKNLEIDGLFYGIGHDPNTSFVSDKLNILDNEKYVDVDACMKTNVDGVFACGDVCDKVYRQGVTAAWMGCVAGIECSKWVDKIE